MTPAASVLAALAGRGLLLQQDPALPSVVGVITGETPRSSWWSHPQARLIFAVSAQLADHPDVLITKLLNRKVTLVHRRLWPALLALACAREPWQLQRLSPAARSLLRRVDLGESQIRATGPVVKELELRLLARCREVHTDSGRHEMRLESWRAWSARVGCGAMRSLPRARKLLEQAAAELGAPPDALPWHGGKRSA